MKRILILGASGTFGKALVEKLSNDEECHLTLASRRASAFYHESERCHVVDCDAMKVAGLRRLIFMGAVGIYDEIPADMDDEDNVKNNPDQIPNRKAADIVENSGLDYTILRPGYLRDGDKDDFTLTFKGEQAKGYVSTIPSVVGLAVRLIHDDTLYVRQSVSITRDMSDTEKL